jgi:hypothetical protein
MTVRDIRDTCARSTTWRCLISKITEAALGEARERQARWLDPVWPAIFLDAISARSATPGR